MKQNILIVDDELAIRSSVRGLLEDEGYTVDEADTGEKCLACSQADSGKRHGSAHGEPQDRRA